MSSSCPNEPAVRVALFAAIVALIGVLGTLTIGVWGINTQFTLKGDPVDQLDNAKRVLGFNPTVHATSPPSANAVQEFIDVGGDVRHGPAYIVVLQILGSVNSERRLLWGRACVILSRVALFPGSVVDSSVVKDLMMEYLGVELTSPGLWGAFMRRVADWCESKGTPLVVYMVLTAAEDVPYKEAARAARFVASLAREYEKIFRLILATDVPQVAGVMTEEYSSALEVPFFNLAQFLQMMYRSSKVAGPLNALAEYYFKMGSNVPKLGDIMRRRVVEDPGLCQVIDSMHELEVAVLRYLGDEEWSLLVRVAEAGPRGLLDAREVIALEKLMKADTKDTILYLTPRRQYAVWRMSHVYHLMGGDTERMKRAGWA